MKDAIGTRMKENYEDRTRYLLPRRSYLILRLDGVSFHTYTKGFKKPFDEYLINTFNESVLNIAPRIQGFKLAYIQSDEISLLLTDFSKKDTQGWFDNNVQKIASVSASMLTAEFNRIICNPFVSQACFDSRVFTIPDRIEVMNYFYWRWKDCERNAINSIAQHNLGHNKCQNKSCKELQELLFQECNVNFSKELEHIKNGRIVYYKNEKFICESMWKLSEDKDKLLNMIPIHGYED